MSEELKKQICGFNINYWKSLGFVFEVNDWFEGGQIWYAEKEFNNKIFTLTIRTLSGRTLARIENLKREKLANHVVSQEEAIRWFSSISEEFKALAAINN